jgi:hypothetical protein
MLNMCDREKNKLSLWPQLKKHFVSDQRILKQVIAEGSVKQSPNK